MLETAPCLIVLNIAVKRKIIWFSLVINFTLGFKGGARKYVSAMSINLLATLFHIGKHQEAFFRRG